MIDAREREMLGTALTSGPAPDEGGCPNPERLWSARRGELASEERDAVVDHLLHCGSCAEAWSRLRDDEVRAPPARSRRPLWAGLALAASLACAALLIGPSLVRESGYRDAPGGTATTIETRIAESEHLDPGAALLEWSAVESARYDIEVSTLAMELVASERGLEEPHFMIPAEALVGLESGTRLAWRVVAIREDGTRVTSPRFVHALR